MFVQENNSLDIGYFLTYNVPHYVYVMSDISLYDYPSIDISIHLPIYLICIHLLIYISFTIQEDI